VNSLLIVNEGESALMLIVLIYIINEPPKLIRDGEWFVLSSSNKFSEIWEIASFYFSSGWLNEEENMPAFIP